MKLNLTAIAIAIVASMASKASAEISGQDVSHYQGAVNWDDQKTAGSQFAYIKATEGTTYTDDEFSANYDGSYQAGLIRGAYHFAHPDASSGADQANYFIANGGGWTSDGKTLPGALDLEYGADGNDCYGLSADDMVSWIQDFGNTYQSSTGRYPVLYTSTSWWNECTGGSSDFATDYALWLARYATTAGDLPPGWTYYTFWQSADSGPLAGDQDVFSGDADHLSKFATGS